MDQLSSDFAAAGLIVAGISADQDSNAWSQYLLEHHTGSVQVLDKNNELAESFEGIAKPTFVLLDAQGRIRWKLVGWQPLTYRTLRREIIALVQEAGNTGHGIWGRVRVHVGRPRRGIVDRIAIRQPPERQTPYPAEVAEGGSGWTVGYSEKAAGSRRLAARESLSPRPIFADIAASSEWPHVSELPEILAPGEKPARFRVRE